MPLGEQIAGAIKEGLSAWKTFIATREEAYKRKRDKEQEPASRCQRNLFRNPQWLSIGLLCERMQAPLKLRRHTADVLVDVALFVEL